MNGPIGQSAIIDICIPCTLNYPLLDWIVYYGKNGFSTYLCPECFTVVILLLWTEYVEKNTHVIALIDR